jgi:hypothetical protein
VFLVEVDGVSRESAEQWAAWDMWPGGTPVSDIRIVESDQTPGTFTVLVDF